MINSQLRLVLENRNGTSSALETGSTQTGLGLIERRLLVIGRRRGRTSRCWPLGVLRRWVWRRRWFSMEGSPQRGSKPIGSCMSTGLLTTRLTQSLPDAIWATRRTLCGYYSDLIIRISWWSICWYNLISLLAWWLGAMSNLQEEQHA